MNTGTKVFFGSIGCVLVLVIVAIGKTFGWWL
jgi:hypothetical protein